MAEQTTQSWWQTLPGIMTAAAGCVSAITALIIALHQAGLFRSTDKPAEVAVAEPSATTILAAAPPAAGPHKEAPANTTRPASIAVPVEPAAADKAPDSAPPERLGALTDVALLDELERANVGDSVGKGAMLSWLADDDRTYRRIARVTARLLNGKRLKGKATDLDVIKYHYLEAVGMSGDGLLPVDQTVNDAKLRLAIVAAFNDKNGTSARRMEGIVEAR